MKRMVAGVSLAMVLVVAAGCSSSGSKKSALVGQRVPRMGDEIVVCGQLFHTGAPVVLWTDPGGYDAYRTERRFAPWDEASWDKTQAKYKNDEGRVNSPNRYGVRFAPGSNDPGDGPLTEKQFEQVRGGGWTLDLLRQKVDQFVYHYDVASTSHSCFATLHDSRGLSVQFMLDLDGTIYQTLDVKERAWQATKANSRSVGIEICNIGAYPPDKSKTLDEFYRKDATGKTRLVLPAYAKAEWIRTPNFVARPARDQAVVGKIQDTVYRQYDFTPQQYDSLIKLTATLCTVLPKINCDYPRDEHGNLITHVLSSEQYQKYQGLLGHYHVQREKQDPGPAFQWDKVVNGARALMGLKPLPAGDIINHPKQQIAAK